MLRVVHFEIPADIPEQVAGFYKKAPGRDILEMGRPYGLLADLNRDGP